MWGGKKLMYNENLFSLFEQMLNEHFNADFYR